MAAKPAERRRRRGGTGAWIGLLLLAALAVAGWLWWSGSLPGVPGPPPAEPPPRIPPGTTFGQPAAEAPPAPRAPAPRAEPAEPLPALAESDAFVRRLVHALATSPVPPAWLTPDHLIDRFVAVVDDAADGRVARKRIPFLAPRGPFRVLEAGGPLRIDPAGYRRYDRHAAVFASLDPGDAAAAYRRLLPLFEQSYASLGRPDLRFDDRFRAAVALLLATPEADASPRLRPRVKSYAFADARLEALAPVQKQLLRTGPDNVRRIRTQLRAILAALDAGGSPPRP